MAPFLSAAWFDEFDARLSGLIVGELDHPALALGQVIHSPDGTTVSYTLLLGSGVPGRLIRDSTEEATVTLVCDLATAQSITEGASVTELLATGQIKIRGNVNSLLSSQEELGALTQALSATN